MKKIILTFLFFTFIAGTAQSVSIDGRLKPYLDDFFAICNQYNIEYKDKLLLLKNIDIVETLPTSVEGSTLGMLQRNENHQVEAIVINWVALLDQEILKVVAFHEFGHYFLGYSEHVCSDCGIIMSKVNTSYFDIATDWQNQIKILFEQSPIYQKQKGTYINTVARIHTTY